MTEVVRQYQLVVDQARGIVPDEKLVLLHQSLLKIDAHLQEQITQKSIEEAFKKELLGHASAYFSCARNIGTDLEKTSHLWTMRKKYKADIIQRAVTHLEAHQEEILNQFLQQASKNKDKDKDNIVEEWFDYLDHQNALQSKSLKTALQYRRYGMFSCLLPLKNRRSTSTSQKFNQWKQRYSTVATESQTKRRSNHQ
jgi:hypothetical protein